MQDEPPSAGQTIPYEDYSAANTTDEEEGATTERSMKPQSSKGAHQKKTKQHQNARPPRKRSSSSSISSSSSSDSSSSSSILSSSDDNSDDASDGDDDRSAGKKKKRKKKATATGKKQPSSSSSRGAKGGKQTHPGTDTAADDGSINKLISVALKSQKKQYKNQIIQSVKSDLMNTLRSRIVQQQRGKKAAKGAGAGGDYDDEDDGGETTVGVDSSSTDKQYRKRIKQAYKENEEGYDDAPNFNSKHHKKTIGSILSKLGEVNDIELFRIPHIDKEMGLDRMEISTKDTKLTKKMLSASPDKSIPEAVYAALKDAYSSCMLYKYFFRRIFPYITVPYITSK